MSKAIFILGMHRSGTSALARVMNLLGVELGRKLMAAASDNERGFWEHESAVQIHEDLLRQLGHNWKDGTPLPEGWMESEAAQLAQAQLAALIDLEFLTAPLWGIKDPRLSLLFPLWLSLLKEREIEPLCIIAWRNPLEVAASLQKRDALAQESALLCWLAYTLESLRHALPYSRAILGYDALLADWRGAAQSIRLSLGLEWPVDSEKAAPEIEAFLSPELRHHKQSTAASTITALGGMIETCLNLLKDPAEDEILALHARWSSWCEPFAPLLREARRAATDWESTARNEAHRATDITGQIEKLYAEYTKTLERQKEAEVQCQMLHQGLHHAEIQVERLENELQAMQQSTSWKVTEALRKMKKIIGEGE